MLDSLRYMLYGDISGGGGVEVRANGGPTCYGESTLEFRLFVTLISTPIHCLLYWFSKKKLQARAITDINESKPKPPTVLEIVFGIVSLLVFFAIMGYKFNAGKGIFMLNPCHVVLIFQSYLLLTTKTKDKDSFFAIMVSLVFGPLAGIIFAVTDGLSQTYEVELYWIEHYLGSFINPLILALCARYDAGKFFNIYYRTLGFSFFALYHRVLLTPLALLTWANLDNVLCHAKSDPTYPYVGKWYLFAADFYVFVLSYISGMIYVASMGLVTKFSNIFRKRLIYRDQKTKDL